MSMFTNSDQKLTNALVKPAIVGLMSYLGSTMANKNINADISLPVLGATDFHVYQGLVGMGSSVITANLESWVFSKMKTTGALSASLTSVGVHSGANIGITYL